MRIIVGITGLQFSGKSTLSSYLEKHGFKRFCILDTLKNQFKEQYGNEPSHHDLEKFVREMQTNSENSVIETVKKQVNKETDNIVLDSVCFTQEVLVFKEDPSFFLVAISAPAKLRYTWYSQSKIISKALPFSEFIELDDLHAYGISNDSYFNISKCIDLANLHIINTKGKEELISTWKNSPCGNYKLRPSWNKYFMQIAWITSSRCNCLRHQIGAVIVKDKCVVSTGYNGTPKGMIGCDEGGCKRCNDKSIPSNEKLDECICIHAEESALLQAGFKHAQGGVLYVTHMPCLECSKKIINAQLTKVYYTVEYGDKNKIKDLYNNVNIELIQMQAHDLIVLKYIGKHHIGI